MSEFSFLLVLNVIQYPLPSRYRLDGQTDAGSGGLVGATAGGSAGGGEGAGGAGGAGSDDQSDGEQVAMGYSPAPAKTFASATGGSRNVDLLSSSPHRSPARGEYNDRHIKLRFCTHDKVKR